jgi:dienelactone hydrolase
VASITLELTEKTAIGAVVVEDVAVPVPDQEPVRAYVVRPAGASPTPAVLFLHWLGELNNDRTEYLGEALTLARHGVTSLLPQGHFPWVPDPDGTAADVTRVREQVAATRTVLDRLASDPGVDESRIALVGHDYGAMYGALVASSDHRVSVMVLAAPDALMGNWFAKHWLNLDGQAREDYLGLFAGLDPVSHTAHLGRRLLFQWAGEDSYVGQGVRDAYAARSPEAQVRLYERANHQLTDAARADRLAFLCEELGLPGP